ncbi:MAG: PD40 domain-containing protein, partial [Gemmatimonadetes bacterium]|nr:PD40 domain-containing protein [Gemmatimonadota bacterium]
MHSSRIRPRALSFPASVVLALFLAIPLTGQERKPLTFVDLMQLREIEQPSISDDGHLIAFTAEPDRGDPEVVVRSTHGNGRYLIPFGSHPVISHDGAFVAVRLNPSLEAREKAGRGDAPRRGMALLATATGEVLEVEEVQSFAFSADGRWLAYHKYEAREEEAEGEQATPAGEETPGEATRQEGD